MSKLTTGSAVLIAALAAGHAGAQGPAGPAGPPGPAGAATLFAHVFTDGSIEEGTPGGITQDNVRRVDKQVEKKVDDDFDGVPDRVETVTEIRYCFSGLPPLFGGNVTLDLDAVTPILFPYLQVRTEDPECSPMVFVTSEFHETAPVSFFILLY